MWFTYKEIQGVSDESLERDVLLVFHIQCAETELSTTFMLAYPQSEILLNKVKM